MAGHKLHPTQVSILRVVSVNVVGISVSEICDVVGGTGWDGAPNSQIIGFVGDLCERGYMRSDTGFPKCYTVTDAGHRAMKAQAQRESRHHVGATAK